MPIKPLTLAIDFDGVIHDYKHPVKGRRMGAPLPGAKEAIDLLSKQGHTIIIHTVRTGQHVADWLDYYDIRGMVRDMPGKPNADVYIDDKAIHHTDWTTTMQELTSQMRLVQRTSAVKSRSNTKRSVK